MPRTNIEWVRNPDGSQGHSWNPLRGVKGKWHCTKVSTGCEHCYSEAMNKRFGKGVPFKVGADTIRLDEKILMEPLSWKSKRTVFTCSMTDLFHEQVTDEILDRIFAVIGLTTDSTFQILTKRPDRARLYLTHPDRVHAILRAMDSVQVDVNASGTAEEWRPCPGYDGWYEVSSYGNVRRIKPGIGTRTGRLTPRKVRGDYLSVCLSRDRIVKQFRIHRLVLEAFHGVAPSGDSDGCHINGDRTDNRAANLSWGSRSDNMATSARHGTAGLWAKNRSTLTVDVVAAIREMRKQGAKLDDIAARFGSTRKQVSAICTNRIFKHAQLSWPLPNVWLGVSAENQEMADRRIPILLQIPAAVRWVSAEPLLGPIDLQRSFRLAYPGGGSQSIAAGMTRMPTLDWLVVGGESGPGARPMHPDWARSLRDQCNAAGVPFFFKQVGQWAWASHVSLPRFQHAVCRHGKIALFSREEMIRECSQCTQWEGVAPVGKKRAGRILDGRTWDEMPSAPKAVHP